MTKLAGRIGALVAAVLFFVVSVSTTGLIIWQIQQDKNKDPTADSQKQLQELMEQQQNQSATNEETGEGKLKGTKLTNFTPVAKTDTLQKIDTVPGTGAEVKAGDTITAHYTGALASDGTIFESSKDSGQPLNMALTGLIQGWQDGIPGMKEGGTRRLIIPAAQAYGPAEQNGIPANSDLVFDIELIKVGQ